MKTGFDEIFDELEEQRATIAVQVEAIAQKDASLAQKDASIAQKDEIIAKLISQISDAGMTPVVKP